jgi:hypothetical protein
VRRTPWLSAAQVSAGTPRSPSSLSSLPPTAAPAGLIEQTSLGVSDDELCFLHIVFEVVSLLNRAENFQLLSPNKQDLCDFLEDQITSLQDLSG